MTVRSAHGFWPDRTLLSGVSGEKASVSQVSLTLLAALLVKYARRMGPIDESRYRLLERVHGHFSEHYLFVETLIEESLGSLNEFSQRHDSIGKADYERELETQLGGIGRQLPEIVRRELLTHLAMFQRLDTYSIEHSERTTTIRSEHGILFGSATQTDIESILNKAAGYKIEPRRRS